MMPLHPFKTKIPVDVLDRYLAGESDIAGDARDEILLQRHSELNQLRQSLAGAPIDVTAAWGRFVHAEQNELQLSIADATSAIRCERLYYNDGADRRGVKSRWIWALGTCSLLAVAAFILPYAGWMVNKNGSSIQSTAARNVFATAPGERSTFVLNDGTLVTLNVASKLTVPDVFGISSREVELVGEAQFTVIPDSRRPFVVRAGGSLVRDLATVFVIRAYPEDRSTRVAVREGKVAVQSAAITMASAVTLNAMQYATVASDGLPVVQPISNMNRFFGWTQGRLIFHRTPLGEALADLSRWYGMEFRVADPRLLKYDISGTVDTQTDFSSVENLVEVIGAYAERVGDVVTIYPRSSSIPSTNR